MTDQIESNPFRKAISAWEWLVTWGKEFANRTKLSRPALFVIGTAVVALIVGGLNQPVGNAEWSAVKAAARFVWKLLGLPTWAGIGLVVIWLGVLATLAWWETRPRLRARVEELQRQLAEMEKLVPRPPPPMARASGEERDHIHDFRVLWNDDAAYPASSLHGILHSLLYNRETSLYWLPLLSRYRDVLKTASDAMEKAVNDDGATSLIVVRKSFEDFFRAYASAFVWIAEIREREHIEDAALGGSGEFQRWLAAHRRFRRSLLSLSQRPGHRGLIPNAIQDFERTAYTRLEQPIGGAFDTGLDMLPGVAVSIDVSIPRTKGPAAT